MSKSIRMFMWGYQPHFRAIFEHWARDVLRDAGSSLVPEALLIGVLRPGEHSLAVCIEPEDGSLPEAAFNGIVDELPLRISSHPDQDIFFGDEPRMREKPENIRRKATREAVIARLDKVDASDGMTSVVGSAAAIGKYDVYPVLRMPTRDWREAIPLQHSLAANRYRIFRSFVEVVVYEILSEATQGLKSQDPGRFFAVFDRDRADVLRVSARVFMQTPGWATAEIDGIYGLFDSCNIISSFPYEGSAGIGKLVIARKNHPALDVSLRLKRPVSLKDHRWARKILQIASGELALLCDSSQI